MVFDTSYYYLIRKVICVSNQCTIVSLPTKLLQFVDSYYPFWDTFTNSRWQKQKGTVKLLET